MRNVQRHPIRGFFAGLLAGTAVSIFLVLGSVIALGTNAIYVPIIVGMVLGVVWAYVAPARRRRGQPEPVPATVGAPVAAGTAAAPAAGEGPPPDSAPAPGEGPPPDSAPAPGEG